jgi:hypothetical protein
MHSFRSLLFAAACLCLVGANRIAEPARPAGQSESSTPLRTGNAPSRPQLNRLNQRVNDINPKTARAPQNPFVVPPPPGQLPQLRSLPPQTRRLSTPAPGHILLAPLPPENRQNWIEREFNGIKYYLIPLRAE